MVCARPVNQGVVTLTITMGAMHPTRFVFNSPSNASDPDFDEYLADHFLGGGAGCPASRAGGSYPMARAPPARPRAPHSLSAFFSFLPLPECQALRPGLVAGRLPEAGR